MMDMDEAPEHIDGIPDALTKATFDRPWDYMLGLRDGKVIAFSGADISPDRMWVHLTPLPLNTISDDSDWHWHKHPIQGLLMCFERGIDVRLSDIAWVADAPWGS